MGIIKLLSDTLSSKIAAGEVIEKPASIVKELVENAIDAHASYITVELTDGGKAFIQIKDNGDGILSEDIELAVQRHATSKLTDEKGLYEINTLGFRGEALYSIGVVSELELITKHSREDTGTGIVIKGGKLISKEIVAHDHGTTVKVSNLFFNTPVRKKFLGSTQSEYRACIDVMDRFVFGWSNVGLKLISNSKERFNVPPASTEERMILRIDPELKGKLYPISADNGLMKIDGFVSDPDYSLNTSRYIYIYVNNRYIIDRSLNYTIINSYSTTLEKGRYPVAVINLSLPPHFIDVNINPTKTAVKFQDRAMVNDVLINAVKEAIGNRHITYTPSDSYSLKKQYLNDIKESAEKYFVNHRNIIKNNPIPESIRHESLDITKEKRVQGDIIPKGEFSSLNIYGQFRATYILATAEDSIVIIDQHAMHERIIFERLVRDAKEKKSNSQMLLTPYGIFLNEHRLAVLNSIAAKFESIGYGISVDDQHVTVNAIPAATQFDPLLLIELIDEYENDVDTTHTVLEEIHRKDPGYRIMATVACKSAVKAGDFLTPEKIKAMFFQLDSLDIPLNCPHGRPFVFVLSNMEIEKFFHRR